VRFTVYSFSLHEITTINSTDNVDDEVERNLRRERETILGSLNMLEKLHTETVEQIRKLRASIYLLDRDLANKESSLQIDQQNLVLRENQIDMKIYEGRVDLDPLYVFVVS
jgi:tektin-1